MVLSGCCSGNGRTICAGIGAGLPLSSPLHSLGSPMLTAWPCLPGRLFSPLPCLQDDEDEYELDIDALDPDTCWKLQAYVDSVLAEQAVKQPGQAPPPVAPAAAAGGAAAAATQAVAGAAAGAAPAGGQAAGGGAAPAGGGAMQPAAAGAAQPAADGAQATARSSGEKLPGRALARWVLGCGWTW